MGLDTSHNCWHGGYGAFKRFREVVAEAAKEHYGYEPDYEKHPHRAFMGWWDSDQSDLIRHNLDRGYEHHPYRDPLDVFFVHSDCDGWIFPHDADVLADRLDALVGYLSDDTESFRTSDRALLRQFIAGLREASENGEVIDFH